MEEKKLKKEMSYQETMDYIDSLQKYGSVPGLTNIINLCEKLGNPQNDLKFVHIAGTNGKGSVLCFISTVLKRAGYRTGRYVSPTIFDYRERIQINGKMISKKDLCIYMTKLKAVCEELAEEGKPHPTPFEIETALAFLYFRDKNCDIVVLETGMGGELDATNIIENTLAAVFVSVSLDHMNFLGNTLEKIASVKSGIIKPGCIVVTVSQKPEVMQVFEAKARENRAELKVADPSLAVHVKSTLGRQTFSYKEKKNITISLPGRYQIDNAVVALETLDELEKKGYRIPEKALYQGLSEASWPGRFEILCKKPVFIADGAHNRDGAGRLADSIRFYFTNRRIIYIMGILRDKEQDEIIKATCPYAERILTVPTPGNRGLSSYELACEVQKFHHDVTALDSVEEAVELSFLMADKDTVIVAFGSLSYLGNLITAVKNRDTKREVKI
ncbi:MAG: bifunctional folylpolyglutamate synthase/dihydrofolate synthase [Suilimivivens sp.]